MSCAPSIFWEVVLGDANVRSLALYHQRTVLDDLTGVTRVTLDLGDGVTVIDTDAAEIDSSMIWWHDSMLERGATVDVLRVAAGLLPLPEGVYESVSLKVYSAQYAAGLRIDNPIKMTVRT